MNWTASIAIDSPRLHRYTLHQDGHALTIVATLELMKNESAFRRFFCDTLATCPFTAFRWEMPALTTTSVQNPCEFVLHDAPRLAPTADPHAFAEHFRKASDRLAIAFDNLSGDATLVVPTPRASDPIYAHFASFLRRAPENQRDVLLSMLGEQALSKVTRRPFWLSTAGAGVAWLHVRLDSRPKYFAHLPYTRS